MYTASEFMADLEPVLGIDPDETKEIKSVIFAFNYYFFSLLMKGQFQELKSFDYCKRVLKGKFF